ncbi:hypothetical protein [Pseudomonas sp. CC120222-01a]|uniref:hypothetical protein n=1 Tax=Pseudomonas sp. CC120222-01a TaxID=1378075 RepID=UPI000D90DED8|nr:hypothetical protein [Pseudomonas sp. CC120222-01a]PVZ41040.1 hypothetical protein N430_02550 [Pseudomonas sp. CC120222-01a]
MKLYENITIGNFLFSLGYSIRDKQRASGLGAAGSVNLLQQTPADQLLGDVLVKFSGVVRLLEFKAEGADLRKERGKHAGLKQIINDLGLAEISREVHWYVETKATADTLGLLTVPYLDAFPRDHHPRSGRLEALVQSTAEAIATQQTRFSGAQINQYLLAIKTVSGKAASGTGGLLLLAEPGGVLKFAPLEDMLELNMNHRDWVMERIARAERSHELLLRQEQEKELAKQMTYDRGLSR